MGSRAFENDWEPKFENGHLLAQRYRIQSLLGLGGMGEVYEAYDENNDRVVAIKTLPLSRTDSNEHVERFQRQGPAALRIRHPGIVEIYDWGTDNGTHFVAMERLQGHELTQRIEDAWPLPLAFVLKVAIQISRAVHAAHRNGVIHRDLKPSNVFLVQSEGNAESVKLLDFGVAKLQENPSFTHTEQVMGTPAYMAPEQLQSAKYVDARADIYAIGSILYEMLTARPPFTASSKMELMLKVANDRPEPIASQRSDVPNELVQVVEKAMAKDPAQRFVTANLLASALEKIAVAVDS
jgi:serine/threonine protein kinase